MLFKIINFLTSRLKYVIAIYIISAVVLIFLTNVSYTSDSLYYYQLAEDCIRASEYYPADTHLYEDYIVSPLYVNLLAGILLIKNSTISIGILNLLLILAQVFILHKITKRIFSESIANLTILLFIFYLNTFGLLLLNLTELLFVLLLITSIYLIFIDSNATLFAGGVLIGISISVRPLGWAFLAALLLIHLYQIIKDKKIIIKMAYMYAGTALFIIMFGTFTYLHFGNFEFTSTTGPVNLLIGANDDATGGFDSGVYEKGKIGYLENPGSMTYKQKGDFYLNQSVKWIQENPGKWISLMPMKIFHSFVWDDVSVTALFNFKNWSLIKSIKNILVDKDLNSALPDSNIYAKLLYILIQIFHHLFYYFLLVTIVLSIYYYLKGNNKIGEINLILIFSVISILIITATVGAPRYKYHIIILLLPVASSYIEGKLLRGREIIEKP